MADNNQTFPVFPAKRWWQLRERFQASMPKTAITNTYLETTLGFSKESARQTLAALRALRLIDEKDTPTDRAERWRHDDTYAEVCEEIRKELYPEELFNAVPDPSSDRDAAKRWFARTASVGTEASRQMANMYQLLMEADPAKKPEQKKSTPSRKSASTMSGNRSSKESGQPVTISPTAAQAALSSSATSTQLPSLHIDIQIHIASDASTDQIDQIFASMAKHLYKRDTE